MLFDHAALVLNGVASQSATLAHLMRGAALTGVLAGKALERSTLRDYYMTIIMFDRNVANPGQTGESTPVETEAIRGGRP
jgi:hypothetical protein